MTLFSFLKKLNLTKKQQKMVKVVALNHDIKESEIFIITKWHFESKPDRLPCIRERFKTHYTPVIEFRLASVRNLDGASPLIQLLNDCMNAVPIERTVIISDFGFVNLSHELMLLFDMLKQSQSVVHIHFNDSPNLTVFSDVIGQLAGKTNLKTLYFSTVHFKSPKTTNALPILFTLPNLERFKFKRCGLGDCFSYLHFLDIIETLLYFVPGLTYLNLNVGSSIFNNCPSSTLDLALSRIVTGFSSLKVLKLRYIIPPNRHLPLFTDALAKNYTLEELDVIDTFRNFSRFRMPSVLVKPPTFYLSQALVHNTHLKRIHYNSGFCDGNNSHLGTLITNNTSLTSLNLSFSYYITSEEMKSFADSLATNTTLKTLSLKACVVDPECFEILGDALIKNTTLENLTMDNMHSKKFNQNVSKFFTSLRHNKGLRRFSFEVFRDVFDVSELWLALAHHPTLEALRITVTDITDDHKNLFGMNKLLSTNHNLCDIEIDFEIYNKKQAESFSFAMAEAIINNKNLIRLVFPNSMLMEMKMKPFYTLIQRANSNLMFTEHSGRIAKPKKMLYQVLKRNRSLNTTLFQLLLPCITWVDPIEEEPIETAFVKRLRLD